MKARAHDAVVENVVERAVVLAERIVDDGLEIVALQEIFDEDARAKANGAKGVARLAQTLAEGKAVGSKAATERRVALVIGNSTYTTIGELVNLRNDARAVDKAFREIGFDHVRLLENLDQGGMLRAL